MSTTTKYTPNFDDPRVINRCNKAIDFVLRATVFTNIENWKWGTKYIDKSFGQHNHALSRYLRQKLLTVTDDKYFFNDYSSKTKQYQVKIDGILFLMNQLGSKYYELREITPYENKLLLQTSITPERTNPTPPKLTQEEEWRITLLGTDPIEYTQTEHREFHGLQYLKKDKKHTLFIESNLMYEYDVSSCAPTIIYQEAQKEGMPRNEVIEFYLSNTKHYREYIELLLNVDKKKAKTILTALWAGALIHKSIYKELGYSYNKKVTLQYDPMITELRKAMSLCWKHLRNRMIQRESVKFPRILENTKSYRISSSAKMNLYLAKEREIREVITCYLNETNNRYFQEHDGWVARNPVNINELTFRIQNETGFKLTFSEEVLKDTHLVSAV